MKKILVVCLGNICRSPAAQGVLQQKAEERNLKMFIDSAGTGAWHAGNAPDARMTKAAARRGYDLSRQKARQVELADFYEFDLVLAMDLSNQQDLLALAPPNRECDISLFLDFAEGDVRETPDPYYGGADGFDHVLDLVEKGAEGLLDYIEDDSG
ncbi:MAG: low molecular weight protein-tyrosine-phosphatase [Pseudomonadota bacterium]